MTSHDSACRRSPEGDGAPTLPATAFPAVAVTPCHQGHSGPRRSICCAASLADVLHSLRKHRLAGGRSPKVSLGDHSSARHAGLPSRRVSSRADRGVSPLYSPIGSTVQDTGRACALVLSSL